MRFKFDHSLNQSGRQARSHELRPPEDELFITSSLYSGMTLGNVSRLAIWFFNCSRRVNRRMPPVLRKEVNLGSGPRGSRRIEFSQAGSAAGSVCAGTFARIMAGAKNRSEIWRGGAHMAGMSQRGS